LREGTSPQTPRAQGARGGGNRVAEGVLYVVDEVRESADGKSYAAYGKIRRLIQ